MGYFLQQLINGLTLGMIYGLIAIGYTMVYGIIGMINFAHGEIFMIGAFVAFITFTVLGLVGIGWVPLALLVVLVATTAGTLLFGLTGALLAAPLTSAFLNAVRVLREAGLFDGAAPSDPPSSQ